MLSYLSAFVASPTDGKNGNLESDKQSVETRILEELKKKRPECEYLIIVCESLNKSIVHRVSVFFAELDASVQHLYVILHVTNGGEASDCAILTKYFNNFAQRNRITMCVPEIAMSSGAQLALCGTGLIMGKYAHLTPFDDKITGLSVKNVKRVVQALEAKQRFTLEERDTILRAKYLRKITKRELKTSLQIRGSSKKTRKRVEALFLNHNLYHSYHIDIDMVRQTGLEVAELNDKEIWDAYKELYQLWLGRD